MNRRAFQNNSGEEDMEGGWTDVKSKNKTRKKPTSTAPEKVSLKNLRFNVTDWKTTTLKLASIPKAKGVGEYFVNADRTTIELGRAKASQYPPASLDLNNLRMNLNEGFEDWTDWKGGLGEKIDTFLQWICKHACENNKTSVREAVSRADVVSGRGLLRRIAITPDLYKTMTWKVTAQKKEGVIFMCGDEEKFDGGEEHKRSIYRGLKLDQFLSGKGGAVNQSEQFHSVCLFDLDVEDKNKISILLSGEVDALDEGGEYLEFKLAEQGKLSYSKCLMIWLQSAFTGVNQIILARKDRNGVLKEVEKIETANVLSMNKTKPTDSPIETRKNLVFLHDVLRQIKENTGEGQTCKLEFIKGKTYYELRVFDASRSSDDPLSVLSKDFMNFFNIT